MRAAGLGALVLLRFLSSHSLSSRFGRLSDTQRGKHVTSAARAALAATLLLASAAYLRVAAGRRPAEQVTRVAHAMAASGLAAACIAMSAAVRLAARWADLP